MNPQEKPISVLLVEDDEEDFILTSKLLVRATGRQFEVVWSSRMEDALSRLEQGGVDVVLLDFTLPDSAGWSSLTRIHDVAPHLPIVFLTGYADDQTGLEAVKRGAQDYVLKGTTDLDRLVRTIRYSLERKRAELEIKRHQEHLHDMVDDATRDLLTANDQLRREIAEREVVENRLKAAVIRLEAHAKSQDQFVSNVSHELRTPLASMAHALENMRAGVLGQLDARVLTYVGMMQEDCHRLMGTINDILDMSRIEANRLELNRQKIHVGRFVARAAQSLKIQLEHKHQQLEMRGGEDAGFIYADAQKLDRVILNLIGNAIKFTPEGGRLSVSVQRETTNGSRGVVIMISDNGVGIAAEHLPRMGERYYRIGEHVTGTGLGLALSKELVEMHGGTLRIESPPPGQERGTQVSIRLPSAASPRVLAADDDETVRTLLTRELVAYGYEPHCVNSGAAALAALEQEPLPDLMIVDVFMPGMNGFELIARTKADHRLRHLPLLLITGEILDAEQKHILKGFGVALLLKPWQRAELIKQLEDLTSGNQRPDSHGGGQI